ncbi:hypothetical protein ACFFDA_10680 (plasmid) [Novosphingobium sp. BL-52-GroH]
MRYNRKLATVSPEEFAELMAIVYSEPAPARPLTPDDHWRRAYQLEQQSKRVLGCQADFSAGEASPTTGVTGLRPRSRHRPWKRSKQSSIASRTILLPLSGRNGQIDSD